MISIETQHFNINRILLLMIGLWPYQRSKFAHFQVILFLSILASSVIFQITIFINVECTADIIINILSGLLYSVVYIIMYNSFRINIHTTRYFLEQFQCICNELEDENEITIIKKCENETKRQTLLLLSITLCGLLILFSMTIWPRILDVGIILLINGSQPYRTTYTTIMDYFIDEERYFLISLHMYITSFIGGLAVTVIGSTLMGYFKCICGMFKIASYRIERAMMPNIFEDISLKEEIGINKRIIYGIDIHCKAMKISKFLLSTFDKTFFFSILAGIISLSLHLFGMIRYAVVGDNTGRLFVHSLMVFIVLLYMFLSNFSGQEIIDHNNDIFSTAYNIQWYFAPLRTQKLILFLLQRGNTAFNLNVGGIFTASLECFATMAKQSISYFTVMYAQQ